MRKLSNFLIIIGIVCLIGAGAYTGFNFYVANKAGKEAKAATDQVVSILHEIQQSGESANYMDPATNVSTDPTDPYGNPAGGAGVGAGGTGMDGGLGSAAGLEANVPGADRDGKTVSGESEVSRGSHENVNTEKKEVREMTVRTIERREYIGVLNIPALDLELAIQSYWNNVILNNAPCRYTGNIYSDDLVICAHNFEKHFGNIHNLKKGDLVIFTDMDGIEWRYEVVLIEKLEATAVEEMQESDYDLTLFTCTIGGEARVTVRCNRILSERTKGA